MLREEWCGNLYREKKLFGGLLALTKEDRLHELPHIRDRRERLGAILGASSHAVAKQFR